MKSAIVLALAALLLPALAHAEPRKKIYLRGGVARLTPLEQSRPMELADVDGPASLAVQNGPIEGSGATVSSATIFGIIVGYRLPWKEGRWAVETILGPPFKVKFQATGTLANESIAPMALGLPTGVGPLGADLGEAKAIPPVVTMNYSFGNSTDAHVTNPMLTAVSEPEMSIAPAPGLVLQGGIDAKIANHVYARLDVKFIAGMLARARVEHIQVQTPELPLFDTVEVGTAKMSMWVNPLIIQAGIGTDF
jgi:outer membrane protein W